MQIELALPDGFLDEEVRCGFHIDRKRKKIWAVELDLLNKFSKVCEENGLMYFLDGGTLLGAIRHQGFIPWDDDVDVIMPRKDYDRLFEIAEDVFQEPYFFQTTLTEDDFFRTHAQLRNSSTTGFILADARKPQINMGIWLDVFPLDEVADCWIAKRLQRTRIRRKAEFMRLACVDDPTCLKSVKEQRIWKKAKTYYKTHDLKSDFVYFNEKILAAYKGKNTRMVGDLSLDWRESCIWFKTHYAGYCYLPFEFLKLRAPLFYKEIMTRQYGDFMKMPKDVMHAEGSHGSTFFDPDTSYNEVDIKAILTEKGEVKE